MTFKCGHNAEEPRNMGRGQARVRRLADYFGRNCPACAEAKMRASLADVHVSIADPLARMTQEQVQERVDKLLKTY